MLLGGLVWLAAGDRLPVQRLTARPRAGSSHRSTIQATTTQKQAAPSSATALEAAKSPLSEVRWAVASSTGA